MKYYFSVQYLSLCQQSRKIDRVIYPTIELSLKLLFCISDAMSRAHLALMGVNANPRANAKTGAHATQSMANAIVRGDGR